MSLILAKLAEAASSGPLDQRELNLQQKLEELALRRQQTLQQSQQAFQASQAEQDRALREQEINRLREQFEQQLDIQRQGLKQDISSSKSRTNLEQERLKLERNRTQADIDRGSNLDKLTEAQIGLIGAQTEQLGTGIPDFVRTLPDDFLAGMDSLTARQFLSDPQRLAITHPRDIAIMSTIVSTGKNPMSDSVDAGGAALALQRMTQAFWEQSLLEHGLNPNTDVLSLQAQPEVLQSVVSQTNQLLTTSGAVNELAKLTGRPAESLTGGPVTVETIQQANAFKNRGRTISSSTGNIESGQDSVSASDNPRIAQASNEVFGLALDRAQAEGFDKVIKDLELIQQHLLNSGSGPSLGPLRQTFGAITDANLFEVIQALRQKQMEQQQLMMQIQGGQSFNVGPMGGGGQQ